MIDIGFSTSYNRHIDEPVVGDKILDDEAFARIVRAVVPDYVERNLPENDGEWYVPLGDDVLPLIACGIGLRSMNPSHYVVRCVRGQMHPYLRRAFALQPQRCLVWVQTRESFITEREKIEDQRDEPVLETNVTHIVTGISVYNTLASGRVLTSQDLIAVLASVGKIRPMQAQLLFGITREAALAQAYWAQFAEVSD